MSSPPPTGWKRCSSTLNRLSKLFNELLNNRIDGLISQWDNSKDTQKLYKPKLANTTLDQLHTLIDEILDSIYNSMLVNTTYITTEAKITEFDNIKIGIGVLRNEIKKGIEDDWTLLLLCIYNDLMMICVKYSNLIINLINNLEDARESKLNPKVINTLLEQIDLTRTKRRDLIMVITMYKKFYKPI